MVELYGDNNGKPLLILYATQTGCALEIAEELQRFGLRRNFNTRLCNMSEYDRADLINEKLVIFVCSTTGDGDPPDNMKNFWRFLLRKSLPMDILSNLNFVIFGLGDSSYSKFNSVAKKLRARLKQLGGNEIHPPCFADDQSEYGLEGDFDLWNQQLWAKLLKIYPLPADYRIDDSPRLPKKHFKVEVVSGKIPKYEEMELAYFDSLQPVIGASHGIISANVIIYNSTFSYDGQAQNKHKNKQ